jgi:hypothetical protein
MIDPTEKARRKRLAEINAATMCREDLEEKYGQVWDTRELARDFIVLGFMSPLIAVQRKSDGAKGSLEFQHNPRFYFDFDPD